MPRISLCNNKFEIDSPLVIDPRAKRSNAGLRADQLADAVERSFAEPIDFPSIAEAVMNEDSIAIAVEPDTACGLQIARHVADWLVVHGNDRERITIVCSDKQSGSKSDDYVLHDPSDQESMAYLLADKEGLPIYINRHMFDADILIPIGTGDGGRSHNSIYPFFCDTETKNRTERLRPADVSALSRMIGSNLGVFWQVRIVTNPGEQVVRMLTGESESVLTKSSQLGLEEWNVQVNQSATMVLATIESTASQSWANLRRAIVTADQAASSEAILVLCTDLGGKPPAFWPTQDSMAKKRDDELAEIFDSRHIYLASQLTQESTERFGFGYLENAEQIQKLIDQNESCLLLRDAHRVGLQTTEAV